jgi:hypothetical protein
MARSGVVPYSSTAPPGATEVVEVEQPARRCREHNFVKNRSGVRAARSSARAWGRFGRCSLGRQVYGLSDLAAPRPACVEAVGVPAKCAVES